MLSTPSDLARSEQPRSESSSVSPSRMMSGMLMHERGLEGTLTSRPENSSFDEKSCQRKRVPSHTPRHQRFRDWSHHKECNTSDTDSPLSDDVRKLPRMQLTSTHNSLPSVSTRSVRSDQSSERDEHRRCESRSSHLLRQYNRWTLVLSLRPRNEPRRY